jgi:hypothetical protein
MNKYTITANDCDMGIYQAESEAHALDLYAQNAGYTDYADVAAQFGDDAIATKTEECEMNTLKSTVSRAAELAYEQDADQIIGRIQGEWAIADREDIGRISQMARPTFIVRSDGLDDVDVMDSMEQAGIDSDQDWENEATTYVLDGETLIVNNASVRFGEEE